MDGVVVEGGVEGGILSRVEGCEGIGICGWGIIGVETTAMEEV